MERRRAQASNGVRPAQIDKHDVFPSLLNDSEHGRNHTTQALSKHIQTLRHGRPRTVRPGSSNSATTNPAPCRADFTSHQSPHVIMLAGQRRTKQQWIPSPAHSSKTSKQSSSTACSAPTEREREGNPDGRRIASRSGSGPGTLAPFPVDPQEALA